VAAYVTAESRADAFDGLAVPDRLDAPRFVATDRFDASDVLAVPDRLDAPRFHAADGLAVPDRLDAPRFHAADGLAVPDRLDAPWFHAADGLAAPEIVGAGAGGVGSGQRRAAVPVLQDPIEVRSLDSYAPADAQCGQRPGVNPVADRLLVQPQYLRDLRNGQK
jgi:hypothetical protein